MGVGAVQLSKKGELGRTKGIEGSRHYELRGSGKCAPFVETSFLCIVRERGEHHTMCSFRSVSMSRNRGS